MNNNFLSHYETYSDYLSKKEQSIYHNNLLHKRVCEDGSYCSKFKFMREICSVPNYRNYTVNLLIGQFLFEFEEDDINLLFDQMLSKYIETISNIISNDFIYRVHVSNSFGTYKFIHNKFRKIK